MRLVRLFVHLYVCTRDNSDKLCWEHNVVIVIVTINLTVTFHCQRNTNLFLKCFLPRMSCSVTTDPVNKWLKPLSGFLFSVFFNLFSGYMHYTRLTTVGNLVTLRFIIILWRVQLPCGHSTIFSCTRVLSFYLCFFFSVICLFVAPFNLFLSPQMNVTQDAIIMCFATSLLYTHMSVMPFIVEII